MFENQARDLKRDLHENRCHKREDKGAKERATKYAQLRIDEATLRKSSKRRTKRSRDNLNLQFQLGNCAYKQCGDKQLKEGSEL